MELVLKFWRAIDRSCCNIPIHLESRAHGSRLLAGIFLDERKWFSENYSILRIGGLRAERLTRPEQKNVRWLGSGRLKGPAPLTRKQYREH